MRDWLNIVVTRCQDAAVAMALSAYLSLAVLAPFVVRRTERGIYITACPITAGQQIQAVRWLLDDEAVEPPAELTKSLRNHLTWLLLLVGILAVWLIR